MLLLKLVPTLRFLAAPAALRQRALPLAAMALRERSPPGAQEAGGGGGSGDPPPRTSVSLEQQPELDGSDIVHRKKKRIKEKQRRKQRIESHALLDSIDSLMVEMPLAKTDTEEEFGITSITKVKLKKNRRRIAGRENEEDNLTKKKKLHQPNYFISLPITNPKITGGVQAVQDIVVQKDHRLSKAMVHPGSLHVSLLVMHLRNEEDVGIAVGALLECKDSIDDLLQGKNLDLSFQGIDHFRNEVGFVKLTENDHTATLTKIADGLFNAGILARGIEQEQIPLVQGLHRNCLASRNFKPWPSPQPETF
uniref:A-kinase anchoring protein 7 n=1 Tax=Sphenodon punctatus TaxID=8508 RepID=A0A8D0GRB9_SPHPU